MNFVESLVPLTRTSKIYLKNPVKNHFLRLTMSLKGIKLADLRTKCIIFGYSRENMQQFSINLPTIIQYLFLMYYWIQEKFVEHGSNMKLDTNQQNLIRFKAIEGDLFSWWDSNTAYGNINTIDINDTSITRCIFGHLDM